MNPTTLRALAAKLQAAPVGSRELDAECARALGWYIIEDGRLWIRPNDQQCYFVPQWTTSLDASRALAKELLPEKEIISGMSNGKGITFFKDYPFYHTAVDEPLACMAAILLALAAKIGDEAK